MIECCPLCSDSVEGNRAIAHQEICDECADVLEFGYPSFPAYSLE